MAINTATIMGRITAPLEIKQVGDYKVLTFSVAVDRPYSDEEGDREADFIRCIAWNGTAEFIGKYFDKGRMIAVTGRLQSGSYEDSNGSMHYPTDLVVSRCPSPEKLSRRSSRSRCQKRPATKAERRNRHTHRVTRSEWEFLRILWRR
jgi:single stranded DNA-binding protein